MDMWYCYQCNFFVFTKKIYCAKCLTPNPIHKHKFDLNATINSLKMPSQVFSSNDFTNNKKKDN
jgi:hypothetical protein